MSAANLYDMGGTPEQNAALAVIMFAAGAAPYSGNTVDERLHAAGIVASLLEAAEAGGFAARDEFLQLIGAGTMTPQLEAHGSDVVRRIGGAAKFFELLGLITTPASTMGVAQ